jgi:hypothetical protein
MKLKKIETIDLINRGAILVQIFNKMYGRYYYIIYENKNIYNINIKICDTLIKSMNLIKINISLNEKRFIIN